MAYVAGENGVYIQELMDKSNEEFDKGNLDESVFFIGTSMERAP
ncbi:hypothetical protein [Bacillus thuringiensis]|nr:hypothetical protein [Bacillus thuringiensis]